MENYTDCNLIFDGEIFDEVKDYINTPDISQLIKKTPQMNCFICGNKHVVIRAMFIPNEDQRKKYKDKVYLYDLCKSCNNSPMGWRCHAVEKKFEKLAKQNKLKNGIEYKYINIPENAGTGVPNIKYIK